MKAFTQYFYVLFISILVVLALYGFGYYRGYKTGVQIRLLKPDVAVSANQTVQTITTIKYVYKTASSNTDLVASVSKPDFSIQVNGKTTTFNRLDNESTMFEKGQIRMEQRSKIGLAITVSPIDLTKRLGLGIGYDKDGFNIQGSFSAVGAFDATVQANPSRLGVGFLLRF